MKLIKMTAALFSITMLVASCRQQPTMNAPRVEQTLVVDTISSGTTNDLYAVSFPSSDTGYAVGANGIILKTIDGGSIWSALLTPTSGASTSQLQSILFWNDSEGIVGGHLAIYRTRNGGISWDTAWDSSQYPAHSTYRFNCDFSSFTQLANGELLAVATGWLGGPQLGFFRSADSGLIWAGGGVLFPGLGSQINSMIGNNNNYAATTSYAFEGVYGFESDLMISTNPDSAWTTAYSSTRNFYGISFLSSSDLMAVGDSGWVNRSTDGGTTWSLDSTGAAGALRAIAASTSSGNVLIVGDSAVLTASGSPWVLSMVGTTFGPLNAVTFTSPTHAIAVGNGGKIYSFDWGG